MADKQALTNNASGSKVGSIPTPPSFAGSTPEESTRGGETNTNPASSDAHSLETAAQSSQLGKALEKYLKDWGIQKLCTVTVDNASANFIAVNILVKIMREWNGCTMLGGKFVHLRCAAHILNLIVCDGLKDLQSSIARIRTSCKFVKLSPFKLATFRRCAHEANITSRQMIILDVPTRWNSTYMMLEVAEKFEKAFTRLSREDAHFERYIEDDRGPPCDEDWSTARIFIRFLQILYHATLSFSSSLNITSNTFFHVLCKILCTLNKWTMSDDLVLNGMASTMKAKFDKYWDDSDHSYTSTLLTSANKPSLNYLLLVAVFLDPRYKLKYVQFTLSEIYG
ncbi:zinc finger BED domain-containing protein RICESLEEPER 2-like [Arachis hypogaea]|uniref:zinc finger BED domain-containing protein RICESLEEPER 2-like n=1 Tax=Arachis hypogaea TaxID=3818 RepID=UPI003B211182